MTQYKRDSVASIGATIRTIREQKGMSIRQMARKSGLSPGYISQVERGHAQPSLNTLRAISRVLDVPIFKFLEPKPKSQIVVRKPERQVLELAHSGLRYELLTPDISRQMEVFLVEMAPGIASSDTPLIHEGEEWILILQGSLELVIGDETVRLEQGDAAYFDGRVPHIMSNKGSEQMIGVLAKTPPTF